jgi:hypothetical protein
MNAVYEISLPKNDADGACVTPLPLLKIPSFHCKLCGCYGDRPAAIWCASLNFDKVERQELVQNRIPMVASSYEEYVSACALVEAVFGVSFRLLPGSMIGARPIKIDDNSLIGGLNSSKCAEKIDFIFAGFNLIVSERVLNVFTQLKIPIRTGVVRFGVSDEDGFCEYFVLENEAKLVWDESERNKYGISVCAQCGAVVKRVSKGTFRMKRFQKEIFESGYVVERGLESPGFFINQALCDKLTVLNIKGACFKKVGDW